MSRLQTSHRHPNHRASVVAVVTMTSTTLPVIVRMWRLLTVLKCAIIPAVLTTAAWREALAVVIRIIVTATAAVILEVILKYNGNGRKKETEKMNEKEGKEKGNEKEKGKGKETENWIARKIARGTEKESGKENEQRNETGRDRENGKMNALEEKGAWREKGNVKKSG